MLFFSFHFSRANIMHATLKELLRSLVLPNQSVAQRNFFWEEMEEVGSQRLFSGAGLPRQGGSRRIHHGYMDGEGFERLSNEVCSLVEDNKQAYEDAIGPSHFSCAYHEVAKFAPVLIGVLDVDVPFEKLVEIGGGLPDMGRRLSVMWVGAFRRALCKAACSAFNWQAAGSNRVKRKTWVPDDRANMCDSIWWESHSKEAVVAHSCAGREKNKGKFSWRIYFPNLAFDGKDAYANWVEYVVKCLKVWFQPVLSRIFG